MTQTIQKSEEKKKEEKKESRFNNFLLDSLYNIIAYIPAAIIALMSLFLIVRHKQNIKNLLSGMENRF